MNSEKIGNETELDVDLGNIKKIIQKYIYLILISTSLSFFVGYLRGKTLPKIWQGQFQIVLNSSNNGSSGDLETSLLSALGKTNANNDLSTQLEIMNSPLVLIPTYENILKAGDGKIVSEQIMIKESRKVKKLKDFGNGKVSNKIYKILISNLK